MLNSKFHPETLATVCSFADAFLRFSLFKFKFHTLEHQKLLFFYGFVFHIVFFRSCFNVIL